MENSYKFFQNDACKYFPCHNRKSDFNCLFCYCPMYRFEDCPGNKKYIESKGRIIKDCSDCAFPHVPQNYDRIMDFLKEHNK